MPQEYVAEDLVLPVSRMRLSSLSESSVICHDMGILKRQDRE